MKKFLLILSLTMTLVSLTSCHSVSPDADEEAVLIYKPWFFGHGLVDAVPDTIVSDILIPRDNEIDMKCEKCDISFAQDIN